MLGENDALALRASSFDSDAFESSWNLPPFLKQSGPSGPPLTNPVESDEEKDKEGRYSRHL